MLTLAVETSTSTFAVALGDGERVLATRELAGVAPRDRDLPGLVTGLLADAGYAFADLQRVAVDVGPGNLTAVRTGVAYANGLAFALGIGVVTADSLELMAARAGQPVLCLRNAGGGAAYGRLGPDYLHGPLAALAARVRTGAVAVAGDFRAEVARLLPGVLVEDTGIAGPDPATLLRLTADRTPLDPTRERAAAPLTETSPLFAGRGGAGDGNVHGGDVEKVVAVLRDGGVVLLPTDTVYGLAVHPEAGDGPLGRLFAMKRRPLSRNLPIMVADADQARGLGAQVPASAEKLLAAFSPGPLTLALGLTGPAPAWLAGRDEIAVRVPDDAFLLDVLRAAGPLLVTSANLSGHDTPETMGEVLAQMAGQPDLALDGGPRQTVPSTLVNCNLPAPVVERVGAVPAERIAEVLEGTQP